MFNPSTSDVRRFFCDTWRKHREGSLLTPLEAIALDWMLRHPEYQTEFDDVDAALARQYSVEDARTNPFLHLSMHLAIAEQLSIDQPPGIRALFGRILARRGDEHAAMHDVMECLGEVVWSAQQPGSAVSADEMSRRYLECLNRRATKT
ncbi:MAG: DUF1841 family protein [Burkholderiaceae bacterium]